MLISGLTMTKAGAMGTERLCRRRPALYVTCLALAVVGAALQARAASTKVTVKVTVVTQACTINEGGFIVVPFGNDVITNQVGGNYKKKKITYKIQCDNSSSNALKMMIEGGGAAFDSSVLGTAKTDFGIALLSNGEHMPINRWLNFNYQDAPTLEAVPVKRPGAILTGGPFSVSATMKVEYQ